MFKKSDIGKVFSSFIVVFCLLEMFIFLQDVLAVNWWNTSYKYRRQIIAKTTSSAVQKAYVVKSSINIDSLYNTGKVRSDRNDLRIVYWNGASNIELPYFFEKGSVTDDIWFKLQTNIGTNSSDSNYYVYYGYSKESSAPNNNLSEIFSSHSAAFVRSSDATNPEGLGIMTTDVPRFLQGKYFQQDSQDKGILIEESRINQFYYRSNFESFTGGVATDWGSFGPATFTENTDLTYVKHGSKSQHIVSTSSVGGKGILSATFALTASTDYTYSVWIYVVSGTVRFEVVNQALIVDSSGTGWQRLFVRANSGATATDQIYIYILNGISAEFYVDVVQVEKTGVYPTSYISSNPINQQATVTRAAESLTYSIINNINATSGSISFWIKPEWQGSDTLDTKNYCLFSVNGNSGVKIITSQSGGNKSLNLTVGNGTSATQSISSWQRNTWHHVVATWNSSSCTLYVDNSSSSGTVSSVNFGSDIVHIGSDESNINQVNGVISNFEIFARELSSNEVNTLYTSSTKPYVLPSAVFFIPFTNNSLTGYSRSFVVSEPSTEVQSEVIYYSSSTTTIIADQGGVVTTPDDTNTKIIVPPGATSTDVDYTVTKINQLVNNAVVVYDFKAEDNITKKAINVLRKPITIIIAVYSNDGIYIDNTNLRVRLSEAEDKLSIAFWNGIDWASVNSDITIADKTVLVSTKVTHLTQYSVVIKSQSGDISFKVFPNPFTPLASQYNYVTFSIENKENDTVEIKIWDITGTLVRTLTSAGGSSLTWDGRNEYGEVVEGGVYIFQIVIFSSPPKRYKGTVVVAK